MVLRQTYLGGTILVVIVFLGDRTIGLDIVQPARADTAEAQQDPQVGRGHKTLGGKQFWTDYVLFHDWRIQRNAVTGHSRLLDGTNRRHRSGSFDKCREMLAEIRRSRELAPMCKPAVILLHGIADSRGAMRPLAERLEQTDRFSVLNMTYASTRHDVAEHAQALASVMEHLDEVRQVSLVGYSLGAIVIRHYLRDQQRSPADTRIDLPIQRIVMIGPPNQGARIASRLGKKNALFGIVLGASGAQLGIEWGELEERLAIPTCDFGIIAGNSAAAIGGNPLIAGDDDLVVAVDETKLPGAADFIVLPVIHAMLPRDPHVVACAANFVEHGYFVSAERRQPIARDEPSPGR